MDVESARNLIATQPPRRLRLDELLRDLGAHDGAHAAADQPAAEAAPVDVEPAAEPADVPTQHAEAAQGGDGVPVDAEPAAEGELPPDRRAEAITVGALVDKASEAGFGFLIGVLSLIAIPFFGLSTPFGLAIALLGAQLMFGMHHPWLPARARRRKLAMTMLDRVLHLLSCRARWLTRLSRRRWESVIFPRMIGLGIVLLALGLALPLPIPLSNLVFLVPLLMFSIGVLERDGVWIALGYAATLIDMGLLLVFGATVAALLEGVWRWLV